MLLGHVRQRSSFLNATWSIILEKDISTIISLINRIRLDKMVQRITIPLINMAIITKKLETLEQALLVIGPIPIMNMTEAYTNYDDSCNLIQKIPGQQIMLSKKFIKNKCPALQILKFSIFPIRYIKYLTINDLKKFDHLINLSDSEIIDGVIFFDIWNYICFLVYYKGIDINHLSKLLYIILWWRHRCTELIQDLGMEVHRDILSYYHADIFLVKKLIFNGVKSIDKSSAYLMKLQEAKNKLLKEILPANISPDLIF